MSKPRIFIVDDDQGLSEALTGYLTLKGFDVKAFLDPDHAFEALKVGEACDLVVSDLRFGSGRNGLELFEKVQAVRKIGFLMLSGNPHGFEEMETKYGIKMLVKPVAPQSLCDEIHAALLRPLKAH